MYKIHVGSKRFNNMMNKRINTAFKIIALFFAMSFINLTVTSDLPELDIPQTVSCDSLNDAENDENFFIVVLEMGLEIYEAIPDTQTSENEEQNYKKGYSDWFYDFHPYLITSLEIKEPLHDTPFINIDFRDHIQEVIPPPPKA